MLRVLETIAKSEHTSVMLSEQENLKAWIDEILTAVWSYQVSHSPRTIIAISCLSSYCVIRTCITCRRRRIAVELGLIMIKLTCFYLCWALFLS